MTVAIDNQRDVGKDLIVDMVKGMASLSANVGILIQKIEDLTSAIDDHRGDVKKSVQVSTECEEAIGDLTGLIDLVLSTTEELGDMAENGDVGIADFGAILKKMGKDEKRDTDSEDDND